MQFEIISHGYCHSDYFQGCGTYGTKWEHVFTGAGMNEKDAYEDACEQAYMSLKDVELPSRPRGINAKRKVPVSECGEEQSCYWYVSIRIGGVRC